MAAKLFCYCGCDHEDGHKKLLDCFTSDHGTYCQTCREEMIKAGQLNQQHKTIAEIRQTIDNEFDDAYPFKSKTPALSSYLKDKAGTTGKAVARAPLATPPTVVKSAQVKTPVQTNRPGSIDPAPNNKSAPANSATPADKPAPMLKAVPVNNHASTGQTTNQSVAAASAQIQNSNSKTKQNRLFNWF